MPLRVYFFQFSILRSGNVDTVEVRTTGMLSFKVLGTCVAEIYVITALWIVA